MNLPAAHANANITVTARVYVIACGAICTPQILANSRFATPKNAVESAWNAVISPPALGRYLTEQSVAFCQVVLSKKFVDDIRTNAKIPIFGGGEQTILTPELADRVKDHVNAHNSDPIPIPFRDPEPQLTLRYTTAFPWHVQIHRDAFDYGDVGPKADPRIVVDLRWYGKSEILPNNRVEFADGVNDAYGMPQPTFYVQRTEKDRQRDQRMMGEMTEVANTLGGYVPGSSPGFLEPGRALHITGTTRMGEVDLNGETPNSVVDHTSRVHNISNLWLGGCNVIPDSTACNPTRTAMAYAIRSANAILTALH